MATDPLFAFALMQTADVVNVDGAATNPCYKAKTNYKQGTRKTGGKGDIRLAGIDMRCPGFQSRFGPQQSDYSSNNFCSSSGAMKRILACVPHVMRMDMCMRETFTMYGFDVCWLWVVGGLVLTGLLCYG